MLITVHVSPIVALIPRRLVGYFALRRWHFKRFGPGPEAAEARGGRMMSHREVNPKGGPFFLPKKWGFQTSYRLLVRTPKPRIASFESFGTTRSKEQKIHQNNKVEDHSQALTEKWGKRAIFLGQNTVDRVIYL